jgi:predicted Zn-dependent peptidase
VWVNVGARDETAAENGLCHLIEHMIFKGTRKRSAYTIAKEFDAIGGHTNAFTSFENTCYHARVLNVHLKKMVEILTDIFLNSIFAENEIERERPVIFQEISMVEDNPEEYVHVLSSNAYWGDNPLGRSILGTRENISAFDSNAVKSFFKRFYQPEHILISVAGNVEHQQILELLAPAFESAVRGDGLPERQTPRGRASLNLHARNLEQVHICLGARGISITDPRRYSFSLLNTIFGGNMSSRLFQRIRERRGLAYSVYSFISSYVDTGMFGAYVGVTPEKAIEAVGLIIEEMDRLMSEKVSPTELEDAKNYTKGNLLLASESVDNQMVRLAQNEINFGHHVPMQEVVDRIEAIQSDDIVALAQHLFQDDQLALTTLGPVGDRDAFENVLGRFSRAN